MVLEKRFLEKDARLWKTGLVLQIDSKFSLQKEEPFNRIDISQSYQHVIQCRFEIKYRDIFIPCLRYRSLTFFKSTI